MLDSNFPKAPSPIPATAEMLPGLIGQSKAMQRVYDTTRRVAKSNASVLILGETGVGKEGIANAIHQLSQRSQGPFIRVNCGALSENLLESELFGHVHGAFTGAITSRPGRFEAAHDGTLFLDEINSTPTTLQVKLLRVLQEKEFQRVGDVTTLATNARMITASNRDLMHEVHEERFREDLYWRLNVVPIEIPPLRERRDDIPSLAAYFLSTYNQLNQRSLRAIAPRAMQALQDYHWPGNVRELQNYIERAVVMAETDRLELEQLPEAVLRPPRTLSHKIHCSAPVPESDIETLIQATVQCAIENSAEHLHRYVVEGIEKELISQLLKQCGGIQTQTAAKLGINRNTLHKKIRDFGLDPPPALDPPNGQL